jgi:hypothetical protein
MCLCSNVITESEGELATVDGVSSCTRLFDLFAFVGVTFAIFILIAGAAGASILRESLFGVREAVEDVFVSSWFGSREARFSSWRGDDDSWNFTLYFPSSKFSADLSSMDSSPCSSTLIGFPEIDS